MRHRTLSAIRTSMSSWSAVNLMRRAPVALGAFLLSVASGGAAQAAVTLPFALGPNLDITGFTGAGDTDVFKGISGCKLDANGTVDASATNPGFAGTPTTPTCTGVATGSQSGTISFAALNGYQIEDLSASVDCGATGGDSAAVTWGSITLTCPTESTVGAAATVSQDVTFPPVLSLDVPLTVSATGVDGGSITVDSFAFNVSLALPSAVPEPSAWALMLIGVGAVGAGLRRAKLARFA